MTKPTVHFDAARLTLPPVEGRRAIVWPFDHPDSERVSNTKSVLTTPVVKVNADGSFETANSLYVPNRKEQAA